MTRQRREAILQAAVIKAVNLTERFKVIEVDQNPVPGGGWQRMTGHPDLEIIGYKEDRVFFIELKTDKGKLLPSQEEWHFRARAYRASVYVCKSVLEVLKICMEKNDRYGWEPDERLDALVEGLL